MNSLTNSQTQASAASSFEQLVQPPVFVVGAARSGTTWVHDILTTPDNVAGIYESWMFSNHAGIGRLFSDAHSPGKRSGLANVLRPEQLVVHVREFAVKVMASVLEPHHRFLVEKSPSHAFSIEIIKQVFPSARFIHVLRDGRDVSVSVKAAATSWMPKWQSTHGESVIRTAKAWHDLVRRVQRDAKGLDKNFLEVRYESLRSDPFACYRLLFDFCQIPYDQQLLQRVHEKTDFEKNYQPNENSFRRGGRVGDWRREFNWLDARRFNREAGDLIVELGYAEPGWWRPLSSRGKRTH